MIIINVFLFLFVTFLLVFLNKYQKEYDKRFGKGSSNFVLGEITMVWFVLLIILILYAYTILKLN
jgi:heme/copper-type cytochrome/quinol oxidase subunit 2